MSIILKQFSSLEKIFNPVALDKPTIYKATILHGEQDGRGFAN